MDDSTLKCKIVSAMWENGIVRGMDWSTATNIATMAGLPDSETGQALHLLQHEMQVKTECPVISRAGLFALVPERKFVEDYLIAKCDDAQDAPQAMKDAVRTWNVMSPDEGDE